MSVEYLESQGFIVAKVEQTIPSTFIKRDAFGFGDLLVAKPGFGAGLVQVTSADHVSHRTNKIHGYAEDPTDQKSVEAAAKVRANAEAWLRSGNRIIVHGWRKASKKKPPTLIEKEITLTDLTSQEPALVR